MGRYGTVADNELRKRDARVRADREHIVQINRADAVKLSAFATKPNGALALGNRLTVEAVEGGGLLIRTAPFRER